MSKELINEIESKIAWNDMNIDETSISLRDVKRLLNELEEQAERVQELESELNKQIEIGYKFEGEVYDLAKQNKHYREALEFYADENNWIVYEGTVETVPGEKARKALEGEE